MDIFLVIRLYLDYKVDRVTLFYLCETASFRLQGFYIHHLLLSCRLYVQRMDGLVAGYYLYSEIIGVHFVYLTPAAHEPFVDNDYVGIDSLVGDDSAHYYVVAC